MTSLETVEDVVTAGIEAQAKVNKHLARVYAAAIDLVKITERGVELGMVQGIAAKTIVGDARDAAGRVGAVASVFSRLHQAQTDACVAAGADMGSVTDAGGVTIGGVSVLGGGR